MTPTEDIPPAYRELYNASGPALRFRIVRDLIGRDESFIATMHLGLDVTRIPEVQALVHGQQLDGSWNGILCGTEGINTTLSTRTAFLRLCELGQERCSAVEKCIDTALLPTLFDRQIVWEFQPDDDAARQIVRDICLHLICRATREHDDAIKPVLEMVLTEWDHFLRHSGHGHDLLPPSSDGYAAVCWYPWNDDDFDRVQKIVKRMLMRAEEDMDHPPKCPEIYRPHRFQLSDKWEYLARPQDLFYDLELAARFGLARELPFSRWLLEEVEMRQDADGWFRFEIEGDIEANWYFPLEKTDIRELEAEWTFRGMLIFKLLEFDV
jgi:hypothetical protein